MLAGFQKEILEYVRENMAIYIFTSSFFLTGIAVGALMVKYLEEGQIIELNYALTYLIDSYKSDTSSLLRPVEVLVVSLRKNVLFLLISWLLGLVWMGAPFVLLLLAWKGFTIGFTVAFIISLFSLKGMLFCIGAVMPHNFLLVPAYIFAAALSMTHSLLKFKKRFFKKNVDTRCYLRQYCHLMFFMLVLVLIGALVEAYITPVFIKMVVSVL